MQNERKFIKSISIKSNVDKKSYEYKLPVIKYLEDNKKLEFSKKVSIFTGENGTGKSTLLEAIAIAFGFNPEGGTKNFNFSTNNSHSNLWENIILSKTDVPLDGFFLRAETFYNVASYIDDINVSSSYSNKSLHKQSHGESFLALVQNRFKGNGIYILDEPESALSPMRLMTLMLEMDRLVKNNSQFIIVTHSPILLAFPNAEIFEFSDKGINIVSYEETEHYKISKSFFKNPQQMLHHLFKNN